MTNTALILAISGCGAALSLDQRRRNGRFWSAEERTRWPIRLMQVQLSLIYFFSAQTKFVGEAWNDGTAASYPWRVYRDWAILPAPQWVAENAYLVNVATWGTDGDRTIARNPGMESAVSVLGTRRRRRPAHLDLVEHERDVLRPRDVHPLPRLGALAGRAEHARSGQASCGQAAQANSPAARRILRRFREGISEWDEIKLRNHNDLAWGAIAAHVCQRGGRFSQERQHALAGLLGDEQPGRLLGQRLGVAVEVRRGSTPWSAPSTRPGPAASPCAMSATSAATARRRRRRRRR